MLQKLVGTLIVLFLIPTATLAKQTIDIGIISFRPVSENQIIWQPLADALNRLSPQYHYSIHSLNEKDLENAVADNQLDFVIVHPLALVTLETKYDAKNIASVIRKDDTQTVLTEYGGVIATLSNRADITRLEDLKNKIIASTHQGAFAVYLLPLETMMQHGIDIRKESTVMFTGQPQDKVLEALRTHKADAAFFRTGYIEELISKGKLSSSELKILNPQPKTDSFHYLRSTNLYPEWAVAATKRPDNHLIKATTIALYQFHSHRQNDYYEFSVPRSYQTTRALMQKYKIYPFDKESFSLDDVIEKYALELIAIFTGITIAGASFTFYYIVSSRKNREHLQEIESILSTASDGIHVHDLEGNLFLFSDSFASMLGYTQEETKHLKVYDWDHHFNPDEISSVMSSITTELISFETQHTRKDGTVFDVEINAKKIILNNKPFIYASSRDISERKRIEQTILDAKEKLDILAHRDPLTNLPNRLSLLETLKTKIILPNPSPFALLFLDLDGFKEVNDSYGHRFGDKLLVIFAKLLQTTFPPETFIVRTGGDEFVILIECYEDHDVLETTLFSLIEKLNYPFEIDGIDVYITASVGIAMYPKDATSSEELLQNADAAMYDAKKMGKNTFSFYSGHLTETALQKTTLATNLKKALTSGDLEVFYQPQIDLKTSKIIGAEALLRWFRAEGAVSPAIFIPLAEETGLIKEVGEFVLKAGCTKAHEWQTQGLLNGRIAINVSARQLIHLDFLSTLERIIEETQCNPAWIELEITESSILENPDKIITLLTQLKIKGFHISIDDFGTGYSSLSYLKNLPIDKLKIDQSFIRNITEEPRNQTIVKTIVSLASGLGMSTIAEGVETLDEFQFLQHTRIDALQGYFYHKPLPSYEIEALLRYQHESND